MEPGPSRGTRQAKPAEEAPKEEKNSVPPEVAEMMKNAIWPSVKMNDMLYNSLLQKPIMVFPTNAMNKLQMKGEFIYRDVEKIVKKIRRHQQPDEPDENDQPEKKAKDGDKAEETTDSDE